MVVAGAGRVCAGRRCGPAARSGNDERMNTAGDTVTVVGIGADGWAGLRPSRRRAAVRAAEVLLGGTAAARAGAPGDRGRAAAVAVADAAGAARTVRRARAAAACACSPAATRCCTASAPPWPGVLGPTAAGRAPAPVGGRAGLRAPGLGRRRRSSVVSAVARPLAAGPPRAAPGRACAGADAPTPTAPRSLAALLVERGFGASRDRPCSSSSVARRSGSTARPTAGARAPGDPLHVVAIEVRAAADTPPLARRPGLPDDAYEHDGQLTKREVRAVTLAALAPAARRAAVGRRRRQRVDRDRVAARRATCRARSPSRRDAERAARIAANARRARRARPRRRARASAGRARRAAAAGRRVRRWRRDELRACSTPAGRRCVPADGWSANAVTRRGRGRARRAATAGSAVR